MIDAHQHFWTPERGDYVWMPKDDTVLSRAYGPADLAPALAACGIEGTVLVQAAPSVEETEYMLGIADATPWVLGVVGWIDFEDEAHRRHLERFARHPKMRGLRPMIQDIPDDDWMLRDDLAWAFAALTEAGLVFDALGFPRHLRAFARLMDRHPGMTVVVDHCMKPQIRAHTAEALERWADGLRRLADAGACCKLSGLVTEAAEDWRLDDLRPYTDRMLAMFGPGRVLWGSDWPVVRLRADYERWFDAARALTADLGDAAQAEIFGGTARRVYQL